MATYTFTTARDVVVSRTFQSDTTKVGYELNAAIQWAFNRIFCSERGPDTIETFAGEYTTLAVSREMILPTLLSATTLSGIKNLSLKLSSDTVFSPMVAMDAKDPRFFVGDNTLAAETVPVAAGHPVYYHFHDNGTIRVSPMLPIGAVIRADYFRFITLGALTGIDDMIHQCIIDMATSTVFLNLTDERWAIWDAKAERNLTTAIHAINRKVQGPISTGPFKMRRSRYL